MKDFIALTFFVLGIVLSFVDSHISGMVLVCAGWIILLMKD